MSYLNMTSRRKRRAIISARYKKIREMLNKYEDAKEYYSISVMYDYNKFFIKPESKYELFNREDMMEKLKLLVVYMNMKFKFPFMEELLYDKLSINREEYNDMGPKLRDMFESSVFYPEEYYIKAKNLKHIGLSAKRGLYLREMIPEDMMNHRIYYDKGWRTRLFYKLFEDSKKKSVEKGRVKDKLRKEINDEASNRHSS